MSTSLLLCHECFSWVQPDGDHCPACHLNVDMATPDPPMRTIQAAIGEVVCLVGEVRVRRKLLPENGSLYATTNGLYFLPHQLEQETRMVETSAVSSSLLWSCAAFVWTPLIFILPFVKNQNVKPMRVQVARPRVLAPGESDVLPEFLMRNPGVFFVPRTSIDVFHRRRSNWLLRRRQGPALKFTPESDEQEFRRRLTQLADTDTWRDYLQS